jgi:hypothetical protein
LFSNLVVFVCRCSFVKSVRAFSAQIKKATALVAQFQYSKVVWTAGRANQNWCRLDSVEKPSPALNDVAYDLVKFVSRITAKARYWALLG